ncbi:hypothetical protein GLYMA_06G060900v4 [Glycine max]|uniref:Uncharacterized protein n=1 Tax=Glycine max TaxID=3847 RepID=A0A0R0JCL5_SOYBN|nr:hypothetical protein JHK87_014413 [Glycine soja]KAH1124401.1 hypothetical protein GYH30_014228 [Glycine max]KRH52311.1 hypothetical protein GLYMA_06G060900v4 [Glycine max]
MLISVPTHCFCVCVCFQCNYFYFFICCVYYMEYPFGMKSALYICVCFLKTGRFICLLLVLLFFIYAAFAV